MTFDEKKKRQFHESFIAGLPKGQGFRHIHLEDLTVAKENHEAVLAAVDIIHINEALDQKFHCTQSHDMFCIRILGPSGKPRDICNIKNLFVDWMHVTPEHIIESCAIFSLYSGDATWNEDLIWS